MFGLYGTPFSSASNFLVAKGVRMLTSIVTFWSGRSLLSVGNAAMLSIKDKPFTVSPKTV